jgi:hypothetical protein
MAGPIIANLSQFVGEDKVYQDTIYQSNGTTPQDITGWGVSFYIHVYGDPDSKLVSKDNGVVGGVVLTTPLLGVLRISVLASDTASIYPGQYEYSIDRTDTGNSLVVTRGCFTLLSR